MQPAAAAVAAGEVAGEVHDVYPTNSTSPNSDNESTNEVMEDGMLRRHHRTTFTIRLLLLALIVPLSA